MLIFHILLEKDCNGNLTTKLYDKGDDLNFSIVNLPYVCSNIPLSSAYGVYVAQLLRYAGACSTSNNFLNETSYLQQVVGTRI